MAYESFFEDMVIDTPEAIANFKELIESGVTWKSNGNVIKFADDELIRKLVEKYNPKE